MKKSLLALGAALACASSAYAQSSVQVTGLMDMYVGSMRYAGEADRTNVVGSGGMTTSWIGFKGQEDLGGGLKASFQLTSFLRGDTGEPGRFGGDPFFSRDANVSLSGGFGALSLGRNMAPNFLPTILFNPFGDSFTVSPLVLHGNVPAGWPSFKAMTTPANDTGWSNQVTYSTPDFNGLKANIHYQFGEQAGQNNKGNLGLNVLYFAGPLALTGFYERAKMTNPNPVVQDLKTAWMLGGSYDFSVAKAFLTYGQAKVAESDYHSKTFSLGADVPVLGKAGSVKLALARTQLSGAAFDLTRTTTSVGYDHYLSKRTDLYAVGMYDKRSDTNSGTSVALGIRHRF